jgi:hypothetical protein
MALEYTQKKIKPSSFIKGLLGLIFPPPSKKKALRDDGDWVVIDAAPITVEKNIKDDRSIMEDSFVMV